MTAAEEASGGQPRPEVLLPGGTSNRGLVVRIGNTVHRPQSEGSAAVHDLLLHLEKVGFEGAPRYLGQDEQGREILSYLEGEAAIAPHPAWSLQDDVLVSVARLLQRYHAAVRAFAGADRRWTSTVPPAYRGHLVSHNDPNLDNIVFRDGHAVALLDFDLASPGSALWDVAVAARLWVPLRDPRDIPDDRASRMGERLRLFVDAYGLASHDRARLARAVVETHVWCYDIVRSGAARGQAGYSAYLTAEAERYDRRGRRWLASHESSLRAWLTR